MKKQTMVEIYHEQTNFVVLKMPNRIYPAVLIQGDSLGELLATAKETIILFDTGKEEASKVQKIYTKS